ncbi:MAG TPA: hypothetical protein VJ201_08810 [Candidatus Babeliales bacterium]|nr:hypothetical protein [Candidatus Babeliales bacterium]
MRKIILLFGLVFAGHISLFAGGAAAAAGTADKQGVFFTLVDRAIREDNFSQIQKFLEDFDVKEVTIPVAKLSQLLVFAAKSGIQSAPEHVEHTVHTYRRTAEVAEFHDLIMQKKFSRALVFIEAKPTQQLGDFAEHTNVDDRNLWAESLINQDRVLLSWLKRFEGLARVRILSKLLGIGSLFGFYEAGQRFIMNTDSSMTVSSSSVPLMIGLGMLTGSFVLPWLNPYEYKYAKRRTVQSLLDRVEIIALKSRAGKTPGPVITVNTDGEVKPASRRRLGFGDQFTPSRAGGAAAAQLPPAPAAGALPSAPPMYPGGEDQTPKGPDLSNK